VSDLPLEDLLRRLAPRVLGAVMRQSGGLDGAEDATQEAVLAAARHWPEDGVPDNPLGWLVQAASQRRLTDQIRSDHRQGSGGTQARRRDRLRSAPPPSHGV
jgi:predicted RNA polymerase sigma factor